MHVGWGVGDSGQLPLGQDWCDSLAILPVWRHTPEGSSQELSALPHYAVQSKSQPGVCSTVPSPGKSRVPSPHAELLCLAARALR